MDNNIPPTPEAAVEETIIPNVQGSFLNILMIFGVVLAVQTFQTYMYYRSCYSKPEFGDLIEKTQNLTK